jgi:hypothetical protein
VRVLQEREIEPRRRRAHCANRRPGHRSNQSRPAATRRGGLVPRRSVLSIERDSDGRFHHCPRGRRTFPRSSASALVLFPTSRSIGSLMPTRHVEAFGCVSRRASERDRMSGCAALTAASKRPVSSFLAIRHLPGSQSPVSRIAPRPRHTPPITTLKRSRIFRAARRSTTGEEE